VRLAAAMLYSALEKQPWLNRLPQPPKGSPGIGWLVGETIRIL
jgi:hypothetical protein